MAGGERLGQQPIGMDATTPRRFDEQVAGPLGKERPQHVQLSGPIDVDPQPPGLADGPLLATRARSDRWRDEHLLAAIDVTRRKRQQRPKPLSPARASGQEVVGAPAGGDLEPSVAARTRRELNQPARLVVQDAELQGAVALWRKRAGEDAAVSEPQAAALRARCWRGAGWERRWLRASDPPCSGMGSPATGPASNWRRSTVVR